MMTRTMRRNYETYKGVKRMNYAIRAKEREYGKQNLHEDSEFVTPYEESDLSKGIGMILGLCLAMFLLGMGWVQYGMYLDR